MPTKTTPNQNYTILTASLASPFKITFNVFVSFSHSGPTPHILDKQLVCQKQKELLVRYITPLRNWCYSVFVAGTGEGLFYTKM